MKHILSITILSLIALAACVAPVETDTSSDVYTIGFIGPLTGNVANLGADWRDAASLAVDDINAAGGIDGTQVNILFEDGTCTGPDASSAYQKLVNANNVDAIIAYCSPELLSIAPMAADDNILIVGPAGTSPAITDAGDHVFRLVPSDALQGRVAAQLIGEEGYERVAILYLNNDYGAGLEQVLSEELGEQIVASESFVSDGAGDIRTQLVKIREANPDVMYLASLPREGVLALKQAREVGIDIPVIASEANKADEFIPVAEGVKITVPSGEGGGYDAFVVNFEDKFGRTPQVFSAETYDTIMVIATAIGINPEDPVVGMAGIPEYEGVAGHVVFDEYGDVSKPYDVFVVENGAFVNVQRITIE